MLQFDNHFRKMVFDLRKRFGDEQSMKLFDSRLLYSLTGNSEYFTHLTSDLFVAAFSRPVAIFGCGSFGQFLDERIRDVVCFIDNNAAEKKNWCDKPVVSLDEFVNSYRDVDIIIGTIDYYEEVKQQLSAQGITEPPVPQWIWSFRHAKCTWIQYFDLPYLAHAEEEIFVDGGCLDGTTSLDFVRWCKSSPVTKQCRIIAFEPNATMAKVCETTLATAGVPVRIIQKGLADGFHKVRFNSSVHDPKQAAIRETGDTEIEVDAMDDVLGVEKVTFVKLDIEGSEMAALRGMRHTIEKYRPKLAISIYHRAEDIVEIPSYIADLHDDYTFYMRHYSFNLAETVLYAL